MPNAAEELMGSCDTALLGTLAIWNRLEGRAALRGADPSDKTCKLREPARRMREVLPMKSRGAPDEIASAARRMREATADEYE